MRHKKHVLAIASISAVILFIQCSRTLDGSENETTLLAGSDNKAFHDQNKSLINEGKNIFRFDSFGDEEFWSGVLHLDKAILGASNGGFGPGVSPKAALGIGLKVDAEALPPSVVVGINSGSVDLDDPATTIALLKLNAVVGVKGNFNAGGNLTSIGITFAMHLQVGHESIPVRDISPSGIGGQINSL